MSARQRLAPSYSLTGHLVRFGARVVGYALAWCIVLGAVVVACSAIVPAHVDAPAYVTPAPSGDVWGLPITEPTPPAPRPSWRVVLPTGNAPAGDLSALCDQLEMPGLVPECAELGY